MNAQDKLKKKKTKWYVYYGDRIDLSSTFSKIKALIKQSNPKMTKKEIKEIMETLRECKIGITSHLAHRKNTLSYKERTYIEKTITFEGTYAQALLVESYLRWSIEQAFPCQVDHIGNDHFRCANSNIMKGISNRFEDWVDKGIAMANAARI